MSVAYHQKESSPQWWQGERNSRRFRLSWLRLFAILVLTELAPILILARRDILQSPFRTLIPSWLLAMLLLAVATASYYGTRIGKRGLQGFTFWGMPSRIRWEEITALRSSRLLGLPWLIVRSNKSRSAMWLPLFYANQRGFFAAISEFAPPSCLLRGLLPRGRDD